MRLLALLVLLALPGFAEDAPDAATQDKIVDYMLRTPTAEVKPAVVDPFLAIDPETVAKKNREKVRAKQLELRSLLKVHALKKQGMIINTTVAAACTDATYNRPAREIPTYQAAGYEEIQESEEQAVMERTLCKEADLGCQFTLIVFHDPNPKKPRRLFLLSNDPLMALISAARAKVGGGNYFGTGLSCMH